MDSHGSPHFTPSDNSFSYMGSNPEGYISYPNSYDMITSGSPAFNPLGLSNNMPSYPMTRVASPREFTGTQTVSPPLTGSSSDVSGENIPNVTGYTAYGSMRRATRQSTSDSNTSASSAHSRNGTGLVQRHNMRFPPGAAASTVMAAGGRHRRRNSRADEDDDDDDFDSDGEAFRGAPQEVVVQRRREEIRKQRIESEQRRRDELRDGYRRLKDVLPVSNQKSSKVSLLDRATSHIKYLEMMQHQLQTNLTQSDLEVARLRQVNEALMLSAAERRSGGQQSAPTQSAASHNGSPKTEPAATAAFN
ncbi:helix loop helix DNA-binding domain protein [Rhizoctonia solani AG-3 Rhs1AP]|uniref:Helix loop helix DNA-binding domain protein n=1 Tax=Rhizoctonia solani AG-3 Rhs1AP TaxID=1086054 RepID=X8JM05_9AGAM|nr:helix loop helix DNA-binding domain protein [Rhizoctonia solani AG-3 Rhs1AP]